MQQAYRIAEDHRLYYFPVTDGKNGQKKSWVVYRRRPKGDPNPRGTFAGKVDGGARALLNTIKRIAGIADQQSRDTTPDKDETAF